MQADLPDHRGESRICANRIEYPADSYKEDEWRARLIGFLQPYHRLIPIAEPKINLRHCERRNIFLSRKSIQFVEDLLRVGALACSPVGVTEEPHDENRVLDLARRHTFR